MRYRYNPYCSCGRCRAHGFMGPAVLITLGVLFLLDQITHIHWLDFSSTWPAFLIVIGLVMFLEHNASAAGHVPREYAAMPPPPPAGTPVYPGQPQAPVVTPPLVPSVGADDGNPVCPKCGTVYNRAVVIKVLKEQDPLLADMQTWSTKFVCKQCGAHIWISGSKNDPEVRNG